MTAFNANARCPSILWKPIMAVLTPKPQYSPLRGVGDCGGKNGGRLAKWPVLALPLQPVLTRSAIVCNDPETAVPVWLNQSSEGCPAGGGLHRYPSLCHSDCLFLCRR